MFNHFYNGINFGDGKQASDPYCWVIGALFGAWIFFGYDASAHLAEETHEASVTVARGMWISTLSGYVLSIPTLIMLLFCIQDFDGIISATYSNNFAEYLIQIVGPKGATTLLSILWIDSTVGWISIRCLQMLTLAVRYCELLHVRPGVNDYYDIECQYC